MDLLTQGVVGAALAQASQTNTRHIAVAGACGFLAGMAPDLDALIRSSNDPLTFLEYHRQFTHSLAFIPIGGFLAALCVYGLFGRRWQLTFLQIFLFCTLGYATHGILDAATSYGTSLFWPFSQVRVSWSLVSIVDPVFSLPLTILVLTSAFRKQPLFARLALCWGVLYLSTAVFQQRAAIEMAEGLAETRGHTPSHIEAKPSFGNILVWRTIYEVTGTFHIDAVRVGLSPKVFAGTTLTQLQLDQELSWLEAGSQQAKDIERFSFFSSGFIAQDPDRPNRIIDIRYAFVPNDTQALWSIEVSPSAAADDHATYLTHRDNARESLGQLWRMMTVK